MKVNDILKESFEFSQDLSALMKGIEHDLANRDKEIDENLKKWFKDKWVRFGPDGKIRGDCARGSSKEGKPKCLSKARAASLRASGGKKAIAAAVRRKRKKDKNPERRGKAINVKNKKK